VSLPDGAWGVLRAGVPRIVLSSVAPIAGFYVGSRVAGVSGGIAVATLASLAVFVRERRGRRPGLIARVSLAVVVLQAVLGAVAGSAFLYFLPKALVDIAFGAAHFRSCLTRRPLASTLARELTPVPPALASQPHVQRLFVQITLAWGTYFTLRGVVTLTVLAMVSTDTFLLVRTLIDAPTVIPLIAVTLGVALRRLGGGVPRLEPSA
jgi:intracellular septation protein A